MSLPALLALPAEPFDPDDDLDTAGVPATDAAIAWRITSTGEAEWAAARWAEADAAIADAVAQADEWHERIQEWADGERRRHTGKASFFEAALIGYARTRRDQDPRAKTLHLPSATVRSRSCAARVVVADESTLLPWLRENAPHAIKEAVSVSELRRLTTVADDRAVVEGELLPGVEVEPASVSYSVVAS